MLLKIEEGLQKENRENVKNGIPLVSIYINSKTPKRKLGGFAVDLIIC